MEVIFKKNISYSFFLIVLGTCSFFSILFSMEKTNDEKSISSLYGTFFTLLKDLTNNSRIKSITEEERGIFENHLDTLLKESMKKKYFLFWIFNDYLFNEKKNRNSNIVSFVNTVLFPLFQSNLPIAKNRLINSSFFLFYLSEPVYSIEAAECAIDFSSYYDTIFDFLYKIHFNSLIGLAFHPNGDSFESLQKYIKNKNTFQFKVKISDNLNDKIILTMYDFLLEYGYINEINKKYFLYRLMNKFNDFFSSDKEVVDFFLFYFEQLKKYQMNIRDRPLLVDSLEKDLKKIFFEKIAKENYSLHFLFLFKSFSENHDFEKCNSVFKEMLKYNLDKNKSFFTLWNSWVEFPEGRLFQKKLHTYIENNALNCKYLFISEMLSSCRYSDLLNCDSQLMKNSFRKKFN